MAIKRCKASFAAIVSGVPRVVRAGALINSEDPILKGREAHFEDVDTYMARRHPDVERATAEPGEKRAVGRPRAAKAVAPKPEEAAKKDDKGGLQAGPAKSTEGGTP